MAMLSRMQSGQFKVFDHLNDWWDEFRLYHRKDGKVVKEGDDLMSATRYAVMMLTPRIDQGRLRQFPPQDRLSQDFCCLIKPPASRACGGVRSSAPLSQ